MRIPHGLLRDTAEIRDYVGSGARGPSYDVLRTVRVSMQPTNRLLTDEDGKTVNVAIAMIVRPEDGPVRPESEVTWEGTTYRVVRSHAYPDTRRPSHYEVSLMKHSS